MHIVGCEIIMCIYDLHGYIKNHRVVLPKYRYEITKLDWFRYNGMLNYGVA